MRRRLGLVLLLWTLASAPAIGADRREAPSAADDPARRMEAFRDRVNAGIVGIVSGGYGGTYLRVAAELADVLDNAEDGLRIMPIAGRGSVQNIWDLVFARGVDLALVQSDVIAYAKRERLFPRVDTLIQYVASLYDEEIHVLARHDVARLEDLAGKKVNFDLWDSGTYMTGNVVFGTLGIAVEPTSFDQALALEKLKRGEIAALVYVVGKPAALFERIAPGSGLHFLAVPADPTLTRTYQPAHLDPADYPRLVADGESVETLSVGAVLAAYAWPPDSERYRKVERFIDAFFSRSAAFQQAPRHPKWHEVSLAAPLPGWKRFPAAEKWLRNIATASDESKEFEQFMWFLDRVKPGGIAKPEERDALFAQYIQWRGAQRANVAAGSSVAQVAPAAGSPEARQLLGPDAVRQIQSALKAQGLYAGPVDGVVGPGTSKAIALYQERKGLPRSATLDLATLRRLAGPEPAPR